MPTVEVRFTPLPSHVRTARLVALAVARRAGVDEGLLDEVRLAVGEACSRAVGVHSLHQSAEPVTMRLSDEVDRFTVEVSDIGTVEASLAHDDVDPDAVAAPADDSSSDDAFESESLPPEFGLAVISGLVDNVSVTSDGPGTQVRMTWPAANPLASAAS